MLMHIKLLIILISRALYNAAGVSQREKWGCVISVASSPTCSSCLSGQVGGEEPSHTQGHGRREREARVTDGTAGSKPCTRGQRSLENQAVSGRLGVAVLCVAARDSQTDRGTEGQTDRGTGLHT